MVLLTFTIGILNVCLGYALAVFLGYGPPSLGEGWDALLAASPAAAPAAGAHGPDLGQAPSVAAAWPGGVPIRRCRNRPPGGSRGIAIAIAMPLPSMSPPLSPAAPTTWQLDETFVEPIS